MIITSQAGSVQKKKSTQTCSSPLPTIPPGSTDTARRSQIGIKGWRSGRGVEGGGRGWEGAVVRLSITKILFPVQRVAKIEASRAAAIIFFFFSTFFFP